VLLSSIAPSRTCAPSGRAGPAHRCRRRVGACLPGPRTCHVVTAL